MAAVKKVGVQDSIINSISKLCIQCIDKYREEVNGIYLSPYRIGGKQRIEVVVINNSKNESESIKLGKKETKINDLKILFNTYSADCYKSKTSTYNYKLLRDLNYGSIIYDPNGKLSLYKKSASNDENIIPAVNRYELPAELTRVLKRKIYSYRRKKN